MKKSTKRIFIAMLIIFSIGLFSCCDDEPIERIHYKKVIPDSLKLASVEKVKEILQTIKVESRVDDEDMEYWIAQAQKTVEDLYGVETVGLYVEVNYNSTFIPYDRCSEEQKKMIAKYLIKER